MIPVKGYVGLYRDEKTNAIINVDETSYEDYINSKNKLIKSQHKLEELEREISDIKSLLQNLLENK